MALVLSVDGERWRAHLRAAVDAEPGLVPVCKGNGYGFGLHRLARRAGWLGVDTIAVGTYEELPAVADRFGGDLLVLTPWRPFDGALDVDPALEDRVVHTVGRPADLEGLLERSPRARLVLERATSMQRHGFSAPALWAAAETLGRHRGARLEGVSFHLPLAGGAHVPEVERLLGDVVAAGLPATPAARTVWVSHLTAAELASLRAAWPELTFRPRVGTSLWLGDRASLSVSATVLDVHPVERGDVYGYRGRAAPRRGHLLVVSGGTAHGIGLEAPTGGSSVRDRAATLARGGLDAAGLVRSPFSTGGKQRLFAEPPHMQASMLLLPAGADVPAVGDRIDVRVRYTTTTFDRVDIS